MSSGARTWWGDFEVPRGAVWRWRVGPLTLWVKRLADEWRVAHTWSKDPFDEALESAIPVDGGADGGADGGEAEELADLNWRRFLFTDTSAKLRVRPRVADRPVVSRPEMPLVLPAGEAASLYMASPVWVELAAGEVAFFAAPIWRLSSTWFGENTLEGTLCYATRSRARIEPGGVRGPRLTTLIELRNRHAEPLTVERLVLPLPQLSVFAAADNQLWTEATSLDYNPANLSLAKISSGSPSVAGPTTQASPAREDPQKNPFARVLNAAIRGMS